MNRFNYRSIQVRKNINNKFKMNFSLKIFDVQTDSISSLNGIVYAPISNHPETINKQTQNILHKNALLEIHINDQNLFNIFNHIE